MPIIATVQIKPVPMNISDTLEKIGNFASDAAAQGATTVVFPELTIPCYPQFVVDVFPHDEYGDKANQEYAQYRRAYLEASQTIPGPVTESLGELARQLKITLVIGLAEKSSRERAMLWNSAVVIGPDGQIIGKHRKLVAVMHERIWFNRGGIEDVCVFHTPNAILGVAICFENLHPSIRRAFGALGEEIHCALWTSPVTRKLGAKGERLEQHREIGVTHALDCGTWVVISSQTTVQREPSDETFGSQWVHSGGSYIIDPLGQTVASVPDYEEGIAVAEADLNLIDEGRYIWNPYGDDLRSDLFGSPIPVLKNYHTSDSDYGVPNRTKASEGRNCSETTILKNDES